MCMCRAPILDSGAWNTSQSSQVQPSASKHLTFGDSCWGMWDYGVNIRMQGRTVAKRHFLDADSYVYKPAGSSFGWNRGNETKTVWDAFSHWSTGSHDLATRASTSRDRPSLAYPPIRQATNYAGSVFSEKRETLLSLLSQARSRKLDRSKKGLDSQAAWSFGMPVIEQFLRTPTIYMLPFSINA